MIWHWVLFTIMLVLVFLEQYGAIKAQKCIYFTAILTVVFIFISSIRWNQNIADWTNYYKIFSYQQIDTFIDIFRVDYWAFEPIFFFAFRAVKYLTNDYLWVDVFLALVSIGVFFYAAKYMTTYNIENGKGYGIKKPLIVASFFTFYCTTLGNIYAVRTNMAAAVCLYSIKYIEKKELKKFLFTILLATLLHFTALVFIPSYFIYYYKINVKTILKIIIVFFIAKLIGIRRMINLIGMVGGRYAEKALRYNITNADSNLSYLSGSITTLIIKAILNDSVVIVIIVLIRKYLSQNNYRINGLINLYISGVFLQMLTIGYNFEFSRIALYGLSTQYFLIPYILRIKAPKTSRVLIFLVFVMYMAFKLYVLIGRQDGYLVFPTVFSR